MIHNRVGPVKSVFSFLRRLSVKSSMPLLPHELKDWPNTESFLSQMISDDSNSTKTQWLEANFNSELTFFSVSTSSGQMEAIKMEVAKMMPFIAARALESPQLFHHSPNSLSTLSIGFNGSVVLTQRQSLSILSHAFFNTLSIATGMDGQRLTLSNWFHIPQKLLCFLVYLKECERRLRADSNWSGSLVSFSRRSVELSAEDSVGVSQSPLTAFTTSELPIEDIPDSLHADFANEYIGGGVLGHGNVQEEIAFTIYPECLVALLFCERMENSEAILIRGPERFCKYHGYGSSFNLAGAHSDTTPEDSEGYRMTSMVAFDAIPFINYDTATQYSKKMLDREIVKVKIIHYRI